MTAETVTTESVLAEMLTENTGVALCDSGGAYGRNWERNKGKVLADFMAAPEMYVDDSGATIDVFHWLRNRLEFDADTDAAYRAFCEAPVRKDESWYVCADEFAEALSGGTARGFNSYNDADLLSQTIQWWEWKREDGETQILLQIHGGCDVRGGYTVPRAFTTTCEGFGWDYKDFTIYCEGREDGDEYDGISWDVRDCDSSCYSREAGDEVERPEPMNWQDADRLWDAEAKRWRCPDGKGWLAFEAPQVY